jgi:hypothetical protein
MEKSNQPGHNPFSVQRSQHLAEGSVAIEQSRAVAEAQGKLAIAKSFPRNEGGAYDAIMASCNRKSFAEQAFYAFPRGKETVTGLTIRMAEELARLWGNIDYGIRELSNKPGESEMEAYCWDMQTNVYTSQKFTVKHERHTRQGVFNLKDPRDIYEMTANQGARRLRARILAVLPPDLIEAASDACRRTLAGQGEDPRELAAKIVPAFSKFGVTPAMIQERYGVKTEALTSENIAELRAIYVSLKDNMTHPSAWFDGIASPAEVGASVEALNALANEAPSDDEPPLPE